MTELKTCPFCGSDNIQMALITHELLSAEIMLVRRVNELTDKVNELIYVVNQLVQVERNRK